MRSIRAAITRGFEHLPNNLDFVMIVTFSTWILPVIIAIMKLI
ncbi:hypothetical protein PATA110616_09520 [Paenibacillus tarimensis]